MTACCPLTDCDDGEYSDYGSGEVKAAAVYECGECGDRIALGERHELATGISPLDGRRKYHRTCLSCVAVRDHFACSGWCFGQLWQDLEENLFPYMVIRRSCAADDRESDEGDCLSGISPLGMGKLVEMRLAWVLSHDEWEPEGFALPPWCGPHVRGRLVGP